MREKGLFLTINGANPFQIRYETCSVGPTLGYFFLGGIDFRDTNDSEPNDSSINPKGKVRRTGVLVIHYIIRENRNHCGELSTVEWCCFLSRLLGAG